MSIILFWRRHSFCDRHHRQRGAQQGSEEKEYPDLNSGKPLELKSLNGRYAQMHQFNVLIKLVQPHPQTPAQGKEKKDKNNTSTSSG